MFDRYTEKARRVIFFARLEAGNAGSEHIEPEHLLIGVLQEERPLFDRMLGEQGGSVLLFMQLQQPAAIPGIAPQADMPLAETAKRVLVRATEEADAQKQHYIDCIHLLLGLLHEQSRAREILSEFGITADRVRADGADLVAHQRFHELRRRFAPLVSQLGNESEPAFTFLP